MQNARDGCLAALKVPAQVTVTHQVQEMKPRGPNLTQAMEAVPTMQGKVVDLSDQLYKLYIAQSCVGNGTLSKDDAEENENAK